MNACKAPPLYRSRSSYDQCRVSWTQNRPLRLGDSMGELLNGTFRLVRFDRERKIQSFFPQEELSKHRVVLFTLPTSMDSDCAERQLLEIVNKIELFTRSNIHVFCAVIHHPLVLWDWQNRCKGSRSAHDIQMIPDSQGDLAFSLRLLSMHPTEKYDLSPTFPPAAITMIDGIVRDIQIDKNFDSLTVSAPQAIFEQFSVLDAQSGHYERDIQIYANLYEKITKLEKEIYGKTRDKEEFYRNISRDQLFIISQSIATLKSQIQEAEMNKAQYELDIAKIIKEIGQIRDLDQVLFSRYKNASLRDKFKYLESYYKTNESSFSTLSANLFLGPN